MRARGVSERLMVVVVVVVGGKDFRNAGFWPTGLQRSYHENVLVNMG
jgi:hypothetical protein